MTPLRKLAAFAAVVLATFVVIPAQPAFAHAALLRTTPATGSVVQNPPTEVTLTFSEPVTQVKEKVRITGPDGKRADTGEPTVDGAVLHIPLKPDPSRGTYLVSYRVVSADSHPVPGGFSFSIGEQSATPSEIAVDDKVSPTIMWLVGAARYLGYAGLSLLVGAAMVLALLWPARLSRVAPKRALWGGFGLLAFATVAQLLLQVPYTSGTFDSESMQAVMQSKFGAALLVRLAVLAVAAIMIRPLISGRAGKVDQWLLLLLGGIGAFTWPISGHPGASEIPAVSVVVDAVHLSGVSVWLGGLIMLFFLLLPQANDSEREAILPVWSRWAGMAIAVVIIAGVVSSLIEVGTVSALFGTTFGRLLLVKIGLVGLMAGAAAFARRNVYAASVNVRKFIAVELVIAALIFGVTAALTQTTPARTAEQTAQQLAQPQIFTTSIKGKLYRLDMDLDPAKVGNNTMHLYAYTPDGKPLPVIEWKVTAALPAAGVEPVEVQTLKFAENHVTGVVLLPTPGEWEFAFTLRISDFDQETVTTKVPIR